MKNYIIVNLATCRLSYYEEDELLKAYPVGIGKLTTPTPAGYYHVVDKLVFNSPAAAEADLGSRRLVLSSDRTCIHGSWHGPVEGQVSGGCVRMYNQDVEELFPKIEIGMPVVMLEG